MKSLFQIEIPRRGPSCVKGFETLQPGMDYFSVLQEDEHVGLKRQDFCPICWEASAKEEALANGRTHWKSKVSTKKDDKFLSMNRDERVLELLRETLQQTHEEALTECFVLALYLARKRIMALRQELKQEDGSYINLYEILASEEMIAVKRVELSSMQTDKIQLKLASRLKNG